MPSASKPLKRASKKSKKQEADAPKDGEPPGCYTFHFVPQNDMLGSQMVSEASISLTGAPPEPHGGVAPLAPAEQVGTADSQPTGTVPPRKRGRKKATTTPSSTLLVPQDGPSSAPVKEEQMAPLSAIDPAPKKTKKVSKQQKTWKVTPNSRESVEFSRQSSKKPLVTLPAIAQQNKLCSVPRIWTSVS